MYEQPESRKLNSPISKRFLWVTFFNQTIVMSLCVFVTLPALLQNDANNIFYFLCCLPIMTAWVHILFYVAHRLIHIRFFYQWIHYMHHEWIYPISFAAIYCHPIEHILANVLPILTAPLLCQLDLCYARLWTTLSMFGAIAGHSGPKVSPVHDYHHQMMSGNYGIDGWMDRILGTYKVKQVI